MPLTGANYLLIIKILLTGSISFILQVVIFFYNIAKVAYKASIHIAARWNSKAGKWVNGRKNWQEQLTANWQPKPGSFTVWMHCASLGEFEQGRPIIEQLKQQIPNCRVLLTFFSPSGYEIRKDYKGADYVMYLPFDSAANANTFLSMVQPQLAIFVKYEFWHYYLQALKNRSISTILVSGIFRSSQPFFQWWGSFHRAMLHNFSHLFVQDESSKKLLEKIGITANATVAGDTRFDRVLETARQWSQIEQAEQFITNKKILVAGSTWKEDEELLATWLQQNKDDWQIILAPHEIKPDNLQRIKQLFTDSIFFSNSNATSKPLDAYTIMVIDNIGFLSKLYNYATVCYVGGGFNKSGHHNILEAAVYSKPVITGPSFQKFKESVDLKKIGAGFTVETPAQLHDILQTMNYTNAGKQAGAYVKKNSGATATIVNWIRQENLLFTK
jgi:3-deoxy-D-manno-octulosonic-acid transferase